MVVEAEGIDLKGTSLNGKEKVITRNKKIIEEKISLVYIYEVHI